MRFPLGKSTASLYRNEPLLDGNPAPAGTLFVLSSDGGYAALPKDGNALTLGRDIKRVHVAVGPHDDSVSREHAIIQCTTKSQTTWWTLRNIGRLPIDRPEAPPLLNQQETVLNPGFSLIYVRGTQQHTVELLVSRGAKLRALAQPEAPTRDGRVDLTYLERLALVAMFQDYLDGSRCPYPLPRNEASEVLNRVPGQSGWTPKRVENRIGEVRRKLAAANINGLTEDSAHPEMLRINLIHYLLNTGSLVPDDLRLLDGPARHEPDSQLR